MVREEPSDEEQTEGSICTSDGAKQNFAGREKRMNRTYEIMFIVRPDVEEADLDKLIAGLRADHHPRWRRGQVHREDGPPPARLHGAQVQ